MWQRTSSRNDANGRGRVHDAVPFYGKRPEIRWNRTLLPHNPEYVRKFYRHRDERGEYCLHETILTASKGDRLNLSYEYKGYRLQWGWRRVREKVEALDRMGRIEWSDSGRPYVMRYLQEQPGTPFRDVITDIPPVSGRAAERTGYPTQKPVALLDRIIRASSNEGDPVLDPFCGCATALVAAVRLNRKRTGIDLSPLATPLMLKGLREDRGSLFEDVLHRTNFPARTDLGNLPSYRTHKHTLYGRQEGLCAGCRVLFPFRNLTIDHVVARVRGGNDRIDNLQLLCGACNSMKGTNSREQFLAKLKAGGIRG